jgi:hypothetical protein
VSRTDYYSSRYAAGEHASNMLWNKQFSDTICTIISNVMCSVNVWWTDYYYIWNKLSRFDYKRWIKRQNRDVKLGHFLGYIAFHFLYNKKYPKLLYLPFHVWVSMCQVISRCPKFFLRDLPAYLSQLFKFSHFTCRYALSEKPDDLYSYINRANYIIKIQVCIFFNVTL